MLTTIAIAAALLATPVSPPTDPLTTEIGTLDTKVFDAYNRCDLPAFSGYFDPKVAFYHDTGGATFERDAMVDGIRKYICGKVKRELIPATFHVYPKLPVVLTSGYSEVLAQSDTHGFELVHKPYSIDTLSRALRKRSRRQ